VGVNRRAELPLMFSSNATQVSDANYIEDVFSTWLYTGNGSTQTMTNGIDLAGKGGLVWIKNRTAAFGNRIYSTGLTASGYYLYTNTTAAQANSGNPLTFSSNGWNIVSANNDSNDSAYNYASWTFRKQAKFFDVVTYTGNGTFGRAIPHNLGSRPGCIFVKRTSTAADWAVWHRSFSNTNDGYMLLNTTAAEANGGYSWWGSAGSSNNSTVFYVGDRAETNASGGTYVAYIFAHDAGGFGATGTDNVISCGSYVGNGSTTGPVITLGYEPQWFLVKAATNTTNWFIGDTTRWWSLNTTQYSLSPNNSGVETLLNMGFPTATGFQLNTAGSNMNANGVTYIYIAIRRGPMKTPTTGTSVFSPIKTETATGTKQTTNFPVDMQLSQITGSVSYTYAVDRLRGVSTNSTGSGSVLLTQTTDAETTGPGVSLFWDNTGFQTPSARALPGSPAIFWNFRRAPGFFDVVCWTNTGATQNVNHNLGAVPELIITKRRPSALDGWQVYSSPTGASAYLILDTTAAAVTGNTNRWNATSPTSTVFTTGTAFQTSQTYVAYLFATVAGVSKVGSYTGTGTTNQINCGFTGGARFVLIKRTDSTGDWYVWDTARGIVAGNDPYLLLNSTAAEVTSTDYVDTYSAGFELSSTAPAALNANGGTYIFLAIA